MAETTLGEIVKDDLRIDLLPASAAKEVAQVSELGQLDLDKLDVVHAIGKAMARGKLECKASIMKVNFALISKWLYDRGYNFSSRDVLGTKDVVTINVDFKNADAYSFKEDSDLC